jgi:hypothetical protein
MPVLYREAAEDVTPVAYHLRPAEGLDRELLDADETSWNRAEQIAWGPPRYRTTFRGCWSSGGLLVRFDCDDDTPWHTMRDRDARLWEEEVVELFLDPAARGADYAEIEISPANVVCDLRIREPWPALRGDLDWNFDGLETSVFPQQDGRWTAVAHLPWTGFRTLSPLASVTVPPRAGDRWRFNVFRIKRPGGPADPEREAVYAAWSVPDAPSFHVPDAFRTLVFAD